MKIAYLAPAFSIHIIRWVNEMANRGHKVYLMSMYSPTEYNLIDNKVEIHLLPFPAPLGYYLNKWHLKKLLKQIKPDLLHTHYASGHGTLSRLSGFHPSLLSVWGSDVFIFPYQTQWKKKILTKNLKAVDYLASTSHIMKTQVEKFVSPKHSVAVTPFGVDCEKFKPLQKLKNENEFIVGTVKTLESTCGVEILIKAFVLLKKNYKGTKHLKLLISGDGSLKNYLMHLPKSLGVDNETEFLGNIPHPHIPEILNKFSVYVSVSESEGFGVAVIEASACGIPVIVSDVGALLEVVKNNETGFIVPVKDPQVTSDAIMKLIDNEELRVKMGLAGRDFVLQNYEWNENVTKMENLYGKIIKG